MDKTSVARAPNAGTRRVVVGFDGSSQSRDALAAGLVLAEAFDDELQLVHVQTGGVGQGLGTDASDVLAGDQMENVANGPRASGARHVTVKVIRDHSAAAGLQQVCYRGGVRALVVGSCHRGPVGRILLGSAGRRLLSGATCPIVVAPAGYAHSDQHRLRSIVCGFDGSPESSTGWEAACLIAREARAMLQVIAVHQQRPFGHVTVPVTGNWIAINEELRRWTEAELAELVRGAPHDLAVQSRFLHGDPVAALTQASEDADLLVLGSRAFGPLGSVFLGSVAARLMVTGACPVLVVPRGAALGEEIQSDGDASHTIRPRAR